MKILLVTASEIEYRSLSIFKSDKVNIINTGIGIPNTLNALYLCFKNEHYDLVINIGIAGSFDLSIEIGSVFFIKNDVYADIGFQSSNHFIHINNSSLKQENIFFKNKKLLPKEFQIDEVSAITVNSTSGEKKQIEERIKLFNASVETMESAAVFDFCIRQNIPFYVIRSISNYIEERNPEKWNISLALSNLQTKISDLLKALQ
ncbi:MAG: hypothetical protein JXR60_01685 [Bacteroidales bacterium]|nr:hypothetical protein [Bacteroidales bacterium]